MRQRVARFLRKWLLPPKDPAVTIREQQDHIRFLRSELSEARTDEYRKRQDALDRIGELVEARQMAGSGPWRASQAVLDDTDRLIGMATEAINTSGGSLALRETAPITAQGATGDIELALQNVEWRREINLSWLEFSRWGVQQIILVSRLYYIKHPWIQRGVNIAASYVFGRGFEVSSEDQAADGVLKDFFERNRKTLGQKGLSELHKRLYYDGQVFFIFFADTVNKGKTTLRTIDATEIFEVITDPGDTDQPWLYHRKWTEKVFDIQTGSTQNNTREAYYPAVEWEPTSEQKSQQAIGGHPIEWDTPVYCMKGGAGVAKWHFDVPKVYAALDWSRNGRRKLEADLTIMLSHAQFAWNITTKGGQQAIQGIKSQIETSVGPTSNLWDANPPAGTGSTFVTGTGTQVNPITTRGAGGDPSDVKEYRNMVACVLEIPPTWLGDMETSNLSTALTLDRPTELGMIDKQEAWRETLICISKYVLGISAVASNGSLRESLHAAGVKSGAVRIIECPRHKKPNGEWVYEASKPQKGEIQIKVSFPAIREGDMPANVKATVEAMTLDNKGGQIVGIDEKVGVGLLYEQLGVEDYQDTLDDQYPENGPDKYDPSRTKEPEPAPIQKALPDPGGQPQAPGGNDPTPKQAAPVKAAERLLRAVEGLRRKRA